ncbi:hypothetical protein HNP73_001510 [Amaricoccus macauensis]|uniref:Uncharacterized protein n=1 Tax=Amaricoccus macauensis TaxID=57001 RepID=A0A840SF92_9RHOB|nr:hypothetical protein [Amaricoccus macauensis]MBB5221589.1 hypothetical protein [Amaricoccus macauensis]
MHHTVESCPDDNEVLRARLDELSREGARILSVLWQPVRSDPTDQTAALSASGNFLIISEVGDRVAIERGDVLRPQVTLEDAPRV